jgi:hypothetical protein
MDKLKTKLSSKDQNRDSISNLKKFPLPETLQFLDLIGRGEPITFQTLDDKRERCDSKLVKIIHGKIEENVNLLKKLNDLGAGVFFTVNSTDLLGREIKNITKVRSFFVDLDGAPLEPVLSAPLPPHIVVESSTNRYHTYWLVNGCPLELFTPVEKILIERFHADPEVCDLPRVMRLPGFFHRKEKPVLVRVAKLLILPPYEFKDFIQAFDIDLSIPLVTEKSAF